MTVQQANERARLMSDRYRELVIMTRPAVLSQGTPGHAMISVATAGRGEEAWGFYGDGIRDEVNEGGWGRYSRSSVVKISEAQYQKLTLEVAAWRRKSYVFTIRDCTNFALALMTAAKIPTPSDSAWPDTLGKDVEALHGRAGGRCLDKRPAVSAWSVVDIQGQR